jgi:hypothetical protein
MALFCQYVSSLAPADVVRGHLFPPNDFSTSKSRAVLERGAPAPRVSIHDRSNENMRKSKKLTPASIVWFEIPADDIARARKFYKSLFGWKINPFPGAAVPDYQHIDTGGADASPDGGMLKRMHPGHTITHTCSWRLLTKRRQR